MDALFAATQRLIEGGLAAVGLGMPACCGERLLWWTAAAVLACAAAVVWLGLDVLFRPRARSYTGRHVLITGASTGLGLALASEFFARGAHVSLLARTTAKLEKATMHVNRFRQSQEQKIMTRSVDVSHDAEVRDAVQACASAVGPIDTLIVCAGTSKPGLFVDQRDEDFRSQMDTNYFGAMNAARAVAPGFVQQQSGHIVFVTSTLGLMAMTGYSSYCGTKFAIRGAADSLRSELAAYNIDVSVCYPPTMDTPGLKTENQYKPEVTWTIEKIGVDIWDPANVAKDFVPKIARGEDHICCDGFTKMERIVANGFAPRGYPFLSPSYLVEVLLLLPLFGLIHSVAFRILVYVVKSFHRKSRAKQD